jgi:hypothetical protein
MVGRDRPGAPLIAFCRSGLPAASVRPLAHRLLLSFLACRGASIVYYRLTCSMVTVHPTRHGATNAAKEAVIALFQKRPIGFPVFLLFVSGITVLSNRFSSALRHECVAWWQWAASALMGVFVLALMYVAAWAELRFASSISIDSRGVILGKSGRPLRWWKPSRCELTADPSRARSAHLRVYCKRPFGKAEMILYHALVDDTSDALSFFDQFRQVYGAGPDG